MRKAPAGGIVRTSLDNTWRTPPALLERVRAYFGGPIPFDPATGPENPTEALRFCAGAPGTLFAGGAGELARANGLEVPWSWPTWVNPPYGRELRGWLAKIQHEAARGAEIVGLLPCARWEQRYFQAARRAANAECLITGRVAFISSLDGKAVGGNPYASMLLGWGVHLPRWREAFEPLGACWELVPLGRAAS